MAVGVGNGAERPPRGPARDGGLAIGSLALDVGIDALSAAYESDADLEARTLLGWLGVAYHASRPRGGRRYSVASARRAMRSTADALGTRDPVERVADRTVDGPNGPIPARIYWPAAAAGAPPRHAAPAVLLWFHGGGFIVGDIESADGTCRALANRSGAAVVSVGYRLAPEHPLEAAWSDCIAATAWVYRQAQQLGVDPGRIAVGGDSAGGCLAAAVAQHCARFGPALAAQVLVYPVTDLARDYRAHPLANAQALSADVTRWLRARLPSDRSLTDPRLSPARAAAVAGTAPALVVTAGCDPLRDDGQRYAARLRAESVPTRTLHYPGQPHGFLAFDLVLHAARDALDRIAAALASAFGEQPRPAPVVRLPTEAWRRSMAEWGFAGLIGQRLLFEAWTLMLPVGSDPAWHPPAPSTLARTPALWLQRYRAPAESID